MYRVAGAAEKNTVKNKIKPLFVGILIVLSRGEEQRSNITNKEGLSIYSENIGEER